MTPEVTTFGVLTKSLNKCHHLGLPHVGMRWLSCSGNVALHQRDRRYHREGWLVNLTHMVCRPELWLAAQRCPAAQNMKAVADSVCLLRYWCFPGYRQPSAIHVTGLLGRELHKAKLYTRLKLQSLRLSWRRERERARARQRASVGRRVITFTLFLPFKMKWKTFGKPFFVDFLCAPKFYSWPDG